MQYKDTLKLYDELLAGGATESSARANATQLGAFGEFLDDFKSSNDKSFREIESTLTGIKKAFAIMVKGFFAMIIFCGLQISFSIPQCLFTILNRSISKGSIRTISPLAQAR